MDVYGWVVSVEEGREMGSREQKPSLPGRGPRKEIHSLHIDI